MTFVKTVFIWWIFHVLFWYCFALTAALLHGNKRAMTIGNAMGVAVFSTALQFLGLYLYKHGIPFL